MLFSLMQWEKALPPMFVTLSGIVILSRLTQLKNAPLPIEVTLLGIVMLFSHRQLLKPSTSVTGKPLYVLGMTKSPVAESLQSVTR